MRCLEFSKIELQKNTDKAKKIKDDEYLQKIMSVIFMQQLSFRQIKYSPFLYILL